MLSIAALLVIVAACTVQAGGTFTGTDPRIKPLGRRCRSVQKA